MTCGNLLNRSSVVECVSKHSNRIYESIRIAKYVNFFGVIFDSKTYSIYFNWKRPKGAFCEKRKKVRSGSNFFSQSDPKTKWNSNRGKAEVINRRFPVDWRTFQLLDFCVSRCKPKKVFLTKNRRNFGVLFRTFLKPKSSNWNVL